MSESPSMTEKGRALIQAILERSLADGLTPPFVVCLLNPQGAMRGFRVHRDGRVEIIARSEADSGDDVAFTHGVLLDQSGQDRGWSWKDENAGGYKRAPTPNV